MALKYSNASVSDAVVQLPFSTGTHGWELVAGVVTPTAPVLSATVTGMPRTHGSCCCWLLLRADTLAGAVLFDGHSGSAWFADVGLTVLPNVACRCPEGQFVQPAQSTLEQDVWFVVDATGSSQPVQCRLCPTGSFCVGGAQLACAEGSFSFAGYTACRVCPTGAHRQGAVVTRARA